MHQAERKDRGLLSPLAAAAVLLLAGGCSGERVYPVTLSFALANGTPVTDGTVTLLQTEDASLRAGGAIASDGTCTPRRPGATRVGLPAGTYQIAVNQPPSFDPDQPSPPPPFARRYSNPATSGLTVTVTRTAVAPQRFVLEPEP